ncbi:MAG TPA: 4-(cytidine 5'-diphospho)-2-C-methyl-D-erythritol kinase [Frankiaceae bacterium]|jgi:4-diphosphocytidyl-2-C-methyl-D-erythritol kinase|nr:4-(cytidine 5'-diphospho)-2-C-methyl-D-erythritol kinase [Frankiaceae bacterium]
MRPAEVTVRAPGKVNLYLAVGALDDEGYHEVRTVLQAVSLYDELTVEAAEPGTVSLTIEGEGAKLLAVDESNLAVRAARLLAAKADISDGVRMALRKAIPVAAGMAGGSADAAAALVACDALWGTALSRTELEALARELGSDVPFSLAGGTALGTGRGDVLSPVLSRGTYHWVFAMAEGALSTPAVYAELDRYREELPRPALWSHSDTLAAVRQGDPSALAAALANDLQAPALRLRPALRRVLEAGTELGAIGALVSGSGPTCAFLTRDAQEAIRLASELAGLGLCRQVRRAEGPVHGARVVS